MSGPQPVLEPCSLGPGSVPLLLVQTLLSGLAGIFLQELLGRSNWAPGLSRFSSDPDVGVLSFTMPTVSGVGGSGTET